MIASRRQLLHRFTATVVLLSAARASAQTKATQREAQYQPRPNNHMSCSMCQLFRPPRACTVVAGDIAPQGWCKFFSLPD